MPSSSMWILASKSWIRLHSYHAQTGNSVLPSSYVESLSIVSYLAVLTPVVQRDERVLVVWSYSLDNIISTCRDFDEKLIQLAWKHRSAFTSLASSAVASANASHANLNDWSRQPAINEKEVAALAKEKELQPKRKKRSCGLGYFVSDKNDVEKTAHGPSHRPVRLFAPFYSGLAAALSTCKPLA